MLAEWAKTQNCDHKIMYKFNDKSLARYTLFFFFYKNVVLLVQAEYAHFSADFRLKYSFIILSAVFVFARFCYLKRKEFVIILLCGLIYVFCAEYGTYVLHVPFIELSLALNILL